MTTADRRLTVAISRGFLTHMGPLFRPEIRKSFEIFDLDESDPPRKVRQYLASVRVRLA
jgi:hypothetical protein